MYVSQLKLVSLIRVKQDIYERYWDLDTTFGKWNLDSAKKKMAHTKFLTVHFETGTIPPIYVLELVVQYYHEVEYIP